MINHVEPKFCERLALLGNRWHASATRQCNTFFGRHQAQHVGSAEQNAPNVVVRCEWFFHCELILLREPSFDGLFNLRVQMFGDKCPSWSTRSAIKKFVTATHCKFNAECVNIKFNCSGRMGEIPQNDCPLSTRLSSKASDIAQFGSAIINDTAYHNCDI